MAPRSNLRQAVDDGAQRGGKVASHADLETAMQAGLNCRSPMARAAKRDAEIGRAAKCVKGATAPGREP